MVHSVELLFDPDTESAIRHGWEALSAAGLPSQAPASRPHLTLVVARRISADVDAVLAPLCDRLPFGCVLGAPMLFGRSPFTLTRLVVPSEALLAVQAEVYRDCRPHLDPAPMPNCEPDRWTPHVTMARRIAAGQLRRALALRPVIREIPGSVVALRRWDGEKRMEHPICGG